MKARLITQAFVCALCMVSQAQELQVEYHPMVEDGKVWRNQVGGTRENDYCNYIDGDTLINGENWKKVYNTAGFGYGGYFYYLALREVEKKVYAIAKGSNRPRLLYDFGLKVGDIVACGVEGNAFGCLRETGEKPDTLMGFPYRNSLRVESIDTLHVSGPYTKESYRRRFTLMLLDAYRELETEHEIVWIEGIGSAAGPFLPWMPVPEPDSMFLRCQIGKEYLFCFFVDNETKKVSSPQYQPTRSDGFHDLLGRRLSGQPQKGIYIQDGKKMGGNR